MVKLHEKTACELAGMLRSKEVSATEICTAHVNRIQQMEPSVNAFILQSSDFAMQTATKVDAKIASGEKLAPLAGLPVAMKDNIAIKGVRTTCASRMLLDFVPSYSAHLVDKLSEHDALLCGKTNMDEFAMGSTGETSFFLPTKNPWDNKKVAGGSSSGSAAAVAACEVPLAVGTDTVGSIRIPSAYCGIVGLKPSFGTVSRSGVLPMASILEQAGPMARTVRDVALLFAAICGKDDKDPASVDYSIRKLENTRMKNMRIGLPKELFVDVRADIKKAIEQAVELFISLGAQVQEISLPSTVHAGQAAFVLAACEAASALGRFDGIRFGHRASNTKTLQELYMKTRSEGFGAEVKKRILLGTYFLTGENRKKYYDRAKALQKEIIIQMQQTMQSCDLLLMPTTRTTAPLIGAADEFPELMYKSDSIAALANLTGLPAMSVPCGQDANGMPIGMQIMGRMYEENLIFFAAENFESAVGGFTVRTVKQ